MKTQLKIKTCPTCGSAGIKKMKKGWKGEYQSKTYTVPSLSFNECPECGKLLGGERTGGEWDGGGKETGGDTTNGESGGKTRGEDHRRETSQTQGRVESYIFMDAPLFISFWEALVPVNLPAFLLQ